MNKLVLGLLMLASSAFAELPPSAYSSMQDKATDVLTLDILRVEDTPGDSPNQHQISVLGQVDAVKRSSDGLKPGDFVTIMYTITQHPAGWAGPGEVPVPKEQDETPAYLIKDPQTGNFTPAAGRMSFSDF